MFKSLWSYMGYDETPSEQPKPRRRNQGAVDSRTARPRREAGGAGRGGGNTDNSGGSDTQYGKPVFSNRAGAHIQVCSTSMLGELEPRPLVQYGLPWGAQCLDYDVVQKIVAVGSRSGAIKLWGRPGAEDYLLSGEAKPLRWIQFLSNTRLLVACSSMHVEVWDIHRALLMGVVPVGGRITCCALLRSEAIPPGGSSGAGNSSSSNSNPQSSSAPAGSSTLSRPPPAYLLVGTENGAIKVVDLLACTFSAYEFHRLDIDLRDEVLSGSADAAPASARGGGRRARRLRRSAEVDEDEDAAPAPPASNDGSPYKVVGLAVSPSDPNVVLVCFEDGISGLWDLMARRPLSKIPYNSGCIAHAATFHPNGKHFCVLGDDGRILVHRVGSPKQPPRFLYAALDDPVAPTADRCPRMVWNTVCGADALFVSSGIFEQGEPAGITLYLDAYPEAQSPPKACRRSVYVPDADGGEVVSAESCNYSDEEVDRLGVLDFALDLNSPWPDAVDPFHMILLTKDGKHPLQVARLLPTKIQPVAPPAAYLFQSSFISRMLAVGVDWTEIELLSVAGRESTKALQEIGRWPIMGGQLAPSSLELLRTGIVPDESDAPKPTVVTGEQGKPPPCRPAILIVMQENMDLTILDSSTPTMTPLMRVRAAGDPESPVMAESPNDLIYSGARGPSGSRDIALCFDGGSLLLYRLRTKAGIPAPIVHLKAPKEVTPDEFMRSLDAVASSGMSNSAPNPMPSPRGKPAPSVQDQSGAAAMGGASSASSTVAKKPARAANSSPGGAPNTPGQTPSDVVSAQSSSTTAQPSKRVRGAGGGFSASAQISASSSSSTSQSAPLNRASSAPLEPQSRVADHVQRDDGSGNSSSLSSTGGRPPKGQAATPQLVAAPGMTSKSPVSSPERASDTSTKPTISGKNQPPGFDLVLDCLLPYSGTCLDISNPFDLLAVGDSSGRVTVIARDSLTSLFCVRVATCPVSRLIFLHGSKSRRPEAAVSAGAARMYPLLLVFLESGLVYEFDLERLSLRRIIEKKRPSATVFVALLNEAGEAVGTETSPSHDLIASRLPDRPVRKLAPGIRGTILVVVFEDSVRYYNAEEDYAPMGHMDMDTRLVRSQVFNTASGRALALVDRSGSVTIYGLMNLSLLGRYSMREDVLIQTSPLHLLTAELSSSGEMWVTDLDRTLWRLSLVRERQLGIPELLPQILQDRITPARSSRGGLLGRFFGSSAIDYVKVFEPSASSAALSSSNRSQAQPTAAAGTASSNGGNAGVDAAFSTASETRAPVGHAARQGGFRTGTDSDVLALRADPYGRRKRSTQQAANKVTEVQDTMAQNMALLAERGEKLGHMSEQMQEMKREAESFAAEARRIREEAEKRRFKFF